MKKEVYICPTCHKEFCTKEDTAQHYLKCWKLHNPHHKSKTAPHSKDKETREVNPVLLDFFQSLGEE